MITQIKNTLSVLVISSLAACAPAKKTCCAPEFDQTVNYDSISDVQQRSYALGYTIANDMKKNGIDTVDIDFVKYAFEDVFFNDTSNMAQPKVDSLMRAISQELSRIAQEKQLAEFLPNKKRGQDYLASKAKNEGVIVLPSGLMYRIVRPGNSIKPKATDVVTANYEGSLIDGSVFDSSYERGQPGQFPLNRVIPGWTEGLQLIGEGGAIELFIPYQLGYGERGSGKSIPPYSTLVFKVELISVQDAHKGHNHAPGEGH